MANEYLTITPQERRARRERADLLFREPEFLDSVCEDIAEGATLYHIANKYLVPYRMLYSWIESEGGRAEAYEMAAAARDANVKDRVLSGILAISETDVRQVFNDDGSLKQINELSDAAAATIQSVDVTYDENGKATKKIRQYDKTKGLELLGRSQKFFTDKIEATGAFRLGDLVNESLKGSVNGGQSEQKT